MINDLDVPSVELDRDRSTGLADGSTIGELVELLASLSVAIEQDGSEAADFIRAVVAGVDTAGAEERADLATLLGQLVETRAVTTAVKESRLTVAGCSTFESAKIFTDLRPMFSDSELRVESLILLNTLSMRTIDPLGRRHTVDVRVTVDELEELRAAIDRALESLLRCRPGVT